MRVSKGLIAVLSLLILPLLAHSQVDTFKIGAELRPRLLFDGGYATPKVSGENAVVFTSQRTRLNAFFENEKWEVYLSFQDVRLFGGDNNYKISGVYGDSESLSLHQAWVKFKFKNKLSLKVGKQLFAYDDQRVISSRNWNDYQVTYDAILFGYDSEKCRLNLGITYNSEQKNSALYPMQKFKTIDFLHYQYQLDRFLLSGIFVFTGNTLSDSTEQLFFRGTYGANAIYKTKSTTARGSAYYQNNMNEIGGNVSAFCFSFFAEQKLFAGIKAGVGVDYLSGTNAGEMSACTHRFDILYGRRHGWYGYLDYFSTTPEQGLQDFMLKLNHHPTESLALFLDWHCFFLAADCYQNSNSTELINRSLGQEVDLKIKWKFNKISTLEFGYSFYFVTESLKQIKTLGDESLKFPQFTYLMLTIKPSFCFK